jgi:tetratricopeptide (TPR) repeat protein
MAQIMLRDYLQQTEDALSSGRINDALANCQHVLTHYPGALEAQRLLGEIYLAQGHLEEAQQTFDWILTSDPENVVAYCNRALICERMLDYDTALDCYQQAYELSRGNSQIRQEFNQLSARAGQSDFMLSRAGLARLYMRGDLLTQAIQEWEVVLAATPDRLDARCGLLEAYWREEQFDRVEQLAKEILDEVPGSLKALLLLAHATAPRDLDQAKELIQRAEALDPELVMAHDLFSDLMAREPNDPFLALLKRTPAILPQISNAQPASITPIVATPESTATGTNGTQVTGISTDPLFGWSSLDAELAAHKDYELTTESAGYTIWSSSDLQPMSSSGTGLGEAELPTPPAWLEMLTQREQPEPGGPMPSSLASPSTGQEPPLTVPPVQPAIDVPVAQAEIPPATPLTAPGFGAEETDDMGWPEWLKSLGAETMDSGPLPQSAVEAPAETPEPLQEDSLTWMEQANTALAQQTSSPWTNQISEPQVASPTWKGQLAGQPDQQALPPWLDQMVAPSIQETKPTWTEQSTQPASPTWLEQMTPPTTQKTSSTWVEQVDEQPVPQISPDWMGQMGGPPPITDEPTLMTLENLEHQLHAEGFIELEPGSLSTIAQSPQEPTLSSALAQLGNLTVSHPTTPVDIATPLSPAIVPAFQPSQPLWPATPDPVPNQSSGLQTGAPIQPTVMSPDAADILLDSELETTMKRPAVRLQPMQQRSAVQRDQLLLPGKERSGEFPAGSVAESNISHRERLLKGYHYQLAGDYDAAMQEYRTIIRSTSDLLDEVISNVRALLKLAPKYSAGYRVLGDAYMRQGEYLQAMEAYNKALTMTKKSKGMVS